MSRGHDALIRHHAFDYEQTDIGGRGAIRAALNINTPASAVLDDGSTSVVSGPDATIWVQRAGEPATFDPMSINAPEFPQGLGIAGP